jgi:succinate-semialdehyde dehydrogenase/glutarate-semialdehyde dehydrogenase
MSRTFSTVNPSTGERIARYETISSEGATTVAKNAAEAFESRWRGLPISERTPLLMELAKVLRKNKVDYAKLMTLEMGKPIGQSEAEVEKCAWTAEVYAEKAELWASDELYQTDAALSYVTLQPLGVVLSIMPWNFPFWQAFRFAIPALVMGNTSILKHSNSCPASSLAIESAFREAGASEGVFSSIIADHDVASALIGSEHVQGVSLTGSVEAGSKIGEIAGRNLKKFVLELGGSDPFIVLEDADVEKAAQVGANARLINSGQSCIAAKRFIVVRKVAEKFTSSFIGEFEKKRTGDPMDPKTDVGPLVNTEAVTALDAQVRDAVSKGAKVAVGGAPVGGPGAFYEPTVLENVNLGMRVMREEVFGPVASVYVVTDEREAIEVANDSQFGLGASLWTSDAKSADSLARKIQSGMVFVNALVKSDPRIPFGGIKKSGTGRELSRYGLKEFVNVKSVNVYGIETPQAPLSVATE